MLPVFGIQSQVSAMDRPALMQEDVDMSSDESEDTSDMWGEGETYEEPSDSWETEPDASDDTEYMEPEQEDEPVYDEDTTEY